ncbi:MAG: KTSC domain-containing protein [Alphaproteobacteria bacterium]|nr:KTSC domain-containing protein [Alphaproteobacteria bacterium]MBV9419213.1 KTSC domain-containing protein [Alphaproteobacteria bacterium]MBV9542445.1 KTSC domain-containing protein [Alphaproteobacteria bacterium]MBV9903030.1 KTSC domain-containing protein [Alphaproteobacteria bacterium]
MSDLFSLKDEEENRWPRLFVALALEGHPNAKQINAALKGRGFRAAIDEGASFRDLLTGYPNSWWVAVALEVTGKRDATSKEVVAALSSSKGQGWLQLPSGTISAVRYDKKKRQMMAIFRSNKRTYLYDDVNQDEFDGLITAESVGNYFNAHLREKPFRELK